MVSVRVLTVLVLATVVVLIVLSQKVNLNLDLVSLGDLDPCGLLQSLRIPSLTEVIENRECVRTGKRLNLPESKFSSSDSAMKCLIESENISGPSFD